MSEATLTIASKNYSAWSLRGWLLCRMAGLVIDEKTISSDDEESRRELLLLSPSVRVPRLEHDDVNVWDTLAIAEYINEIRPQAGIWPANRAARAHCRAICGEIHSGFYNLRSALPMNLKAKHQTFKVFSGARPDIERIKTIWSECLAMYGGPYLFGPPTAADAMYAPVCTRFNTYSVPLEELPSQYCATIFEWPLLQEWIAAAMDEPEELVELEVEF